MKAINYKLLVFISAFLLFNSCKDELNQVDPLDQVLSNLKTIKSASYNSTVMPFAPGDTIPNFVALNYYKEFSNPSDTFVGASYVMLKQADTSVMGFGYDGIQRALVYHQDKGMVLDSFRHNKLPFRTVDGPFFTKSRYLIEYALKTKDSINIEMENFDDSLHFSFEIYDTIPELIGRKIVYTPALYGSNEGEVAKYDLWIRKSDMLPYKLRREMPHEISIEIVRDVKLNTMQLDDFHIEDYFPQGYEIRAYGSRSNSHYIEDWVGKRASEWSLNDYEGNEIALNDIKSKVLMIQFTSINCGPCNASIEFLKKLETEYENKDFDFVSIESYSRSQNALKRHHDRHQMNYKYLMATKEVRSKYKIQSVPVFFILDQNRVIRKVIKGYGKDSTDEEIRSIVEELIG